MTNSWAITRNHFQNWLKHQIYFHHDCYCQQMLKSQYWLRPSSINVSQSFPFQSSGTFFNKYEPVLTIVNHLSYLWTASATTQQPSTHPNEQRWQQQRDPISVQQAEGAILKQVSGHHPQLRGEISHGWLGVHDSWSTDRYLWKNTYSSS